MRNEQWTVVLSAGLALLLAFACARTGPTPPKPPDPVKPAVTSQPPPTGSDGQAQVQPQPIKVEITNLPQTEKRPILEPRDSIAIASGVIALCAVFLTIWQARQLAVRGRTDTFRTLRTSYASLRKELRKVSPTWASLQITTVPMSGTVSKFAIIADLERYWHHGFDEWYLTKKKGPWYYDALWDDYYEPVLAKAAKNEVLLLALFRAFSACDTEIDKDFVREIWRLTNQKRTDADKLATGWNALPSQTHKVTVPDVIKD